MEEGCTPFSEELGEKNHNHPSCNRLVPLGMVWYGMYSFPGLKVLEPITSSLHLHHQVLRAAVPPGGPVYADPSPGDPILLTESFILASLPKMRSICCLPWSARQPLQRSPSMEPRCHAPRARQARPATNPHILMPPGATLPVP